MLRYVPLDTEGVAFVTDNSATAHMCNDKDLFKSMALYEENEGPSVATVGPRGKVKGTGDVCLSCDDDEGIKHTHVLSNVCYMPDSPFNLFSITEFGKAIKPDDQEDITEGKSIQTFARYSVFKWDNEKHQRTFVHPPNNLSMLTFNNGCGTFKAFCSAVQEADASELRCALTSSKDEGNREEAEGKVNFIEALQAEMNRSEGDIALGVFMKHHGRLNHPPLSIMH